MMKITAKELAHSVGLQTNPEYYYCRGAIITDLDGTMLAKIHQKIKNELGNEAANAFVTMVQNIKLLSARKFLESIYALENNGWKYSEAIQKEINEKKPNYGRMNAVYEYHASLRNDTDFIRNAFLECIDEKHDSILLRFERYRRALHGEDNFGDFFDEDYDDDENAEYE